MGKRNYLNARDDRLAKMAQYKVNNREAILKGKKRYRKQNIDKCREMNKAWYANNKEHKKLYDIQYRLKTEEKRKKLQKLYRINNSEKIKVYLRNRYKLDKTYKLKEVYRHRILKVIKGVNKSKPTLKLLGCSVEELWNYLESKFKPGMKKENHGKIWHIDHIMPIASFDLTNPKQQAKCFHYTNLQPLWARENLSKGAKILKSNN
jgi:hypothetical protein